MSWDNIDSHGLKTALLEAQAGRAEGGIPIGAALVHIKDGILGSGHNQRVQKSSPTLHAEIAALEKAGRLPADIYRHCTMYTTLSPCSMCSGAILLYKVPRVVIGENSSFTGDEELLRSRGVEVTVLNTESCKDLMVEYIRNNETEWKEDIGEVVACP